MNPNKFHEYLFHSPSWDAFWRGFARVIGPSEIVRLTLDEIAERIEQEYEVTPSDWENVGQDIRDALQRFREEHPELA